jgi:hypothetical protein
MYNRDERERRRRRAHPIFVDYITKPCAAAAAANGAKKGNRPIIWRI